MICSFGMNPQISIKAIGFESICHIVTRNFVRHAVVNLQIPILVRLKANSAAATLLHA